jgi:hypothetical protein
MSKIERVFWGCKIKQGFWGCGIFLFGSNFGWGGGIFLIGTNVGRGCWSCGKFLINSNVGRGGCIFLGNIKRHTSSDLKCTIKKMKTMWQREQLEAHPMVIKNMFNALPLRSKF